MKERTIIQHVALQFNDETQAEIFFTKILGLSLKKTFTLPPELSNEIFGIKEEVEAVVYGNDHTRFEIFITKKQSKPIYEHVCIEINNKEEFVERCKKFNIETKFVKKDLKTLLFIKDYAGNLYEVKEKNS